MPLCVGCGEVILDKHYLRVDPNLEWHSGCLTCSSCNQSLTENDTCMMKEGKTYCKKDYTRLFSWTCSRCGDVIGKLDFVMRARDKVYHIHCFRCVTCNRQLKPGDECAVREDDLLCKKDYFCISTDSTGATEDMQQPMDYSCRVYSSARYPSKTSSTPTHMLVKNDTEVDQRKETYLKELKDTKPTRVRTVLNEKQLHTLRTCYEANCRPDSYVKEQLTMITGLSPRVIRVWFQNKRCKDKKRSIAQKHIEEKLFPCKNDKKQEIFSCDQSLGSMSDLSEVCSIPSVSSESIDSSKHELSCSMPEFSNVNTVTCK